MIFRLSQKLQLKIKAGPLATKPLNANPYADWSSHVFTADRAQYIILTNTRSLYSCVLHGRGVSDDDAFIKRAFSNIREFMEYDGQSFAYMKFVAPETGVISFAKAFDRSVTGSMNDMIQCAKIWLIEEDLSPFDVGFKLNDMPMSALKYSKPREVFKSLGDIGSSNSNGRVRT
ncbi:MAG: hypothetical protein H0T51_15355 [Pirellulales bacterium]|nr:hypothetical protein [Pirellulales bacterium]